jgi:hypothetical protein
MLFHVSYCLSIYSSYTCWFTIFTYVWQSRRCLTACAWPWGPCFARKIVPMVVVLWSNECQDPDVVYSISGCTFILSSWLFVSRTVFQHICVSSSAHWFSVVLVMLFHHSSSNIYSILFQYEHWWTTAGIYWLDRYVISHRIRLLMIDRLCRLIMRSLSYYQCRLSCSSSERISSI